MRPRINPRQPPPHPPPSFNKPLLHNLSFRFLLHRLLLSLIMLLFYPPPSPSQAIKAPPFFQITPSLPPSLVRSGPLSPLGAQKVCPLPLRLCVMEHGERGEMEEREQMGGGHAGSLFHNITPNNDAVTSVTAWTSRLLWTHQTRPIYRAWLNIKRSRKWLEMTLLVRKKQDVMPFAWKGHKSCILF